MPSWSARGARRVMRPSPAAGRPARRKAGMGEGAGAADDCILRYMPGAGHVAPASAIHDACAVKPRVAVGITTAFSNPILQRPPGDIAPAESFRPIHPRDRFIGGGTGFGEGGPRGANAQDAPAIRHQPPRFIPRRAGMKHLHARHLGRRLQAADLRALQRRARITTRGHDDEQARQLLPAQVEIA